VTMSMATLVRQAVSAVSLGQSVPGPTTPQNGLFRDCGH
jgi:hypothetical protein